MRASAGLGSRGLGLHFDGFAVISYYNVVVSMFFSIIPIETLYNPNIGVKGSTCFGSRS